jgi:hypothetical protein
MEEEDKIQYICDILHYKDIDEINKFIDTPGIVSLEGYDKHVFLIAVMNLNDPCLIKKVYMKIPDIIKVMKSIIWRYVTYDDMIHMKSLIEIFPQEWKSLKNEKYVHKLIAISSNRMFNYLMCGEIKDKEFIKKYRDTERQHHVYKHLEQAIIDKDIHKMKRTLEEHFTIDSRGIYVNNPILKAIIYDRMYMLKILIEDKRFSTNEINGNPIICAIKNKKFYMLEFLLNHERVLPVYHMLSYIESNTPIARLIVTHPKCKDHIIKFCDSHIKENINFDNTNEIVKHIISYNQNKI